MGTFFLTWCDMVFGTSSTPIKKPTATKARLLQLFHLDGLPLGPSLRGGRGGGFLGDGQQQLGFLRLPRWKLVELG